jgi:reactive intermediate/imine deaminase
VSDLLEVGTMALERINPEGLGQPIGPYVNAVKAGKLVFVSGQVAFGPDGQVVGVGDPEAQMVQIMESIGANLRAAGATFADVAKVTIFVTDMAHRVRLSPIRERYFQGSNPASTLVEVSALAHPDLLVEVEAIAVVPD